MIVPSSSKRPTRIITLLWTLACCFKASQGQPLHYDFVVSTEGWLGVTSNEVYNSANGWTMSLSSTLHQAISLSNVALSQGLVQVTASLYLDCACPTTDDWLLISFGITELSVQSHFFNCSGALTCPLNTTLTAIEYNISTAGNYELSLGVDKSYTSGSVLVYTFDVTPTTPTPAPTPVPSNCFTAHVGAGCTDATCQGIVCGVDPYCCNTEWDFLCANLANNNCPNAPTAAPITSPPSLSPVTSMPTTSPTLPPSDCGISHTTVGCNRQVCQDAVCALDSYCCDVIWDYACAVEAQSLCNETATNTDPLEYWLYFQTDGFASEMGWRLEDVNNNTILMEMPKGSISGNNIYQGYVLPTLIDGRQYRIVFTDSFGDGFCCGYGMGWFQI